MTTEVALPTGLYIDGEWITRTDSGTLEHINPATGRAQQDIVLAGASEVDQAVLAAQGALREWRAWNYSDRRRVILKIAELQRRDAAEIGRIATAENGVIYRVTSNHAPWAADFFEYYAGWVDKLHGESSQWGGLSDKFNYTMPEPVGVVGVVLTWNGPAGSIGLKVAAALAAGCTVVIKPPELAPFTTLRFAQLCEEAGIPRGVVNVVPGGPEAGEALVAHPGIDKVTFTGGPEVAKKVQASAARNLTPLVLELGGKSANIVFEDADADAVGRMAGQAISELNGQLCVLPTRLLVHRKIYDQVVERAAATVSSMRVGDPFDPSSDVGPVVSKGAHDRILGIIDAASKDGEGELVAGGSSVADEGYYVHPAVFRDVDNRSSLAQNEVFGPVLAAMPFDDEDEAVALANDSVYGLAAYIQTRDVGRVHRIASRLDAGNVAVNGGLPVGAPFAPFGGFKTSGYGKEGGYAGIYEFLRFKNVNMHLD